MTDSSRVAPDALAFDPFDPGFRADPYPSYARLRLADPVHRSPLGVWLLTRYSDCAAVLRDPRFGVAWEEHMAAQMAGMVATSALLQMQLLWMLFRDPPDHTRLRTLVNKAFTPRAVERMRPHVQQIVDTLLDAAAERGEIDLVADFADVVPGIVICEMLGVPFEDREAFKVWGTDMARTLDPIMSPEILESGNVATKWLLDYFRGLVAERRARPGEDLMSALIAAEAAGDRLTEDELLASCVLLFGAGHETTMNLIGNGTLALARNPDQARRLREDPSVAGNAIEELLRYDSPVQLTGRIAHADAEIGGTLIRRGEEVITLIGAANRDPAQFSGPDRLDLGRPDPRPLTFGAGAHFCLGAPLARLEGQIALGSLFRRFPDLALAGGEPDWRETFTLRGLRSLPVSLGPARRQS